MNIFRKITWTTMKQNRTRTIVTIIGIILSTSLFTAVTVFTASLFHFMEQEFLYQYGNYHISASMLPTKALQSISEDNRVRQTVSAAYVGYGQLTEETISIKPYLYISGADEAFFNTMPIHLTSGRLPENNQEIILPVSMLTQNNLQLSLTDQITVNLGNRLRNGIPLGQMLGTSEGEVWIPQTDSSRIYTIVGFYATDFQLNYCSLGYSAYTYDPEPNTGAFSDSYILLNNPSRDMEAFVSDHQLSDYCMTNNTYVLMLSGVSEYTNLLDMVYFMVIMLCLLIFTASVSLIYNAFAISVSERTKQFGLLSSIGATKRQIRKSVFTEATTLSALGIPAGVLTGIAGIGITMYLCRDLFDTIFVSNFHLTLHINCPAILFSALIALITVLVSAWIPSRRAMKVTAIEAIRQNRDIKSAPRTVRYSRLLTRIFHAEGMLAKKYFKNDKKKYRATIFSLAVSIILFVSSSAFCLYLTVSAENMIMVSNYGVAYRSSVSCTEILKLQDSLASARGVKNLSIYAASNYCYADDLADSVTDEYKNYAHNGDYYTLAGYSGTVMPIRYIDDKSFLNLLHQYGQEPDAYFSKENPKVLFINNLNYQDFDVTDDQGNQKAVCYSVDFLRPGTKELTTIPLPPVPEGSSFLGIYWTGDAQGEGEQCYYYIDSELFDLFVDVPLDETGHPLNATTVPVSYHTLQIGYLLEDAPLGCSNSSGYAILYPISLFPEMAATDATVYFETDTPQETLEDIKQILKDYGIAYEDSQLEDAGYYNRQNRNLITLIHVFSYGFIILISLISVANVFNTISTNVALRRRDYAMLRSMGLTRKGMNRIMCYECLLYGSRALVIGLPVSVCFSYALYQVLKDSASVHFFLPWNAIAAASCCVFLVVLVTMVYAMSKLKADNTIDALKNENL